MDIRLATPDDALAITQIHVTAWREAYRGIVPDEYLRALSINERCEVWKRLLSEQQSTMYVAEEGASIAGWASVAASRDAGATNTTGELWAIYIDPAHWNKGIGRALWEWGRRELLRQGFEEATLWVFEKNDRARRFYSRIGFVRDADAQQILQRGGKDLQEIRLRKQPL